MKRKVLFLCTGNYYRSRFAEEMFNNLCAARGVPWVADSRGLHFDVHEIGNAGAISSFAIERLRLRGWRPFHGGRPPMTAFEADLDAADLLVALDREEHEPLVAERFPLHRAHIKYWDVRDIAFEHPSSALDRLESCVAALVDELARELP